MMTGYGFREMQNLLVVGVGVVHVILSLVVGDIPCCFRPFVVSIRSFPLFRFLILCDSRIEIMKTKVDENKKDEVGRRPAGCNRNMSWFALDDGEFGSSFCSCALRFVRVKSHQTGPETWIIYFLRSRTQ